MSQIAPPSRWAERIVNPDTLAQQLESRGVATHYQYVHDLSALPAPAPGTPAWFGRYTWTLSATIDFHQAFAWSGTTGYLSLQQHAVEFGRLDDRVSQGYSNLDTDPHTSLDEAWLQQQFHDGRITLKAGRIDANAVFDAVPSAADFLNASMGYSPTLMSFPSYPAPKPAAEIALAPRSSTRIAAAAFFTNGGRLSLLEADQAWRGGLSHKGGRAAFGWWHLAKPLPRLDGTLAPGTGGFYGVLEQSLWTQPTLTASPRTLTGYLQAGSGDRQVNPCGQHLGGGLILSAPFHRRPADSAGIATSSVHVGPGKSETVFEAYYKLGLIRSVSIVPDLQYFPNPQGDSGKDMLVLTPRLVITF